MLSSLKHISAFTLNVTLNLEPVYGIILAFILFKEQKQLGRTVKNFDETKWNTIADEIVYNANLAKFSQNLELKNKLLLTSEKLIVECSPYDSIWGNGLNITDTLNTNINEWKGTNRLGLAIMRVRATLTNIN